MIALVAVGLVLAVAAAVLQGEYAWWAPRTARGLVRAASWWQLRQHARYREEWLAELDFVHQQEGVPGLVWGLGIFVSTPFVGVCRGCRHVTRIAVSLSSRRRVIASVVGSASMLIWAIRRRRRVRPGRTVSLEGTINIASSARATLTVKRGDGGAEGEA